MSTVREVFECTKCNQSYTNREDAEACSTRIRVPAGKGLVIKHGVVWRHAATFDLKCNEAARLTVVPTFGQRRKRTHVVRNLRTLRPTLHDAPQRLTVKLAREAVYSVDTELLMLRNQIEDAEKRKRWFEKFSKEEEKKNNA